ncbi:MAG: class I SAM-dependent methyltransferase [Pseudomonadales bacterium]|nr:class I SAM-dependent methyltransferase [Pseudomonadales bacterium]
MYKPIELALTEQFNKFDVQPRRVFHGRGHQFEGLEHVNLDWFAPVLLITAYSEIDNLDVLLALILRYDLQHQIKSVIYQKRSSSGAPSRCIWGEQLESVVVVENGIKFEVQPGARQNAGLFLDMRPLRSWLTEYSQGKNLLNLFAYTCSLSVAALAGDARQVVSVDMSKPSINWGRRNHQLNDQDLRSVRSIPHNLFKSWGRVQKFGPYNTVIVDPPSRQPGSFDVERDYVTVLKKLSRLCLPAGDLFVTLNSPYLGFDYIENLMQRYQPKFRLLGRFPISPEFADRYPERGLKILHFRT